MVNVARLLRLSFGFLAVVTALFLIPHFQPAQAASMSIVNSKVMSLYNPKIIYQSGNYIYSGTNFHPANAIPIQVYNVAGANASNPQLVGTIDVPAGQKNTVVGTIGDFYVSGNYLYVATESNPGYLVIFDITNPAAPVFKSAFTSSHTILARAVYVQGNYAYLGVTNGITVINISTITAPSEVMYLSINGDPTMSILASNNYLYLTTFGGRFEIVSISNPTAPSVVSSTNPVSGIGVGVKLYNNYAFVTWRPASNGPPILKVYDVSNPYNVLTISGGQILGTNITGFDMFMSYAVMYASDNLGNANFIAYNMSNPAAPSYAAKLTVGLNGNYSGSQKSIAVLGQYAYVADVFGAPSNSQPNLYTVNVGTLLPAPTVSLTANPTNPAYNGSSTLTWTTTNANSCTASSSLGNWTGAKTPVVSGSEVLNTLTQTGTYTLTCTGYGGTTASTPVTIVVGTAPNPTVSLTASQTSVFTGGNSTLSWTTTNASVCTASSSPAGWSGSKTPVTSGSELLTNLTTQTTYTLTCTGYPGTTPAASQVTILVNVPDVQLTLSGYFMAKNGFSLSRDLTNNDTTEATKFIERPDFVITLSKKTTDPLLTLVQNALSPVRYNWNEAGL